MKPTFIIHSHMRLVLISSYLLYLRILWGLSLTIPLSLLASTGNPLLEQGQTALRKGQFEQAIHYWQKVIDQPITLEIPKHIDLLIQLASAYQALGMSDRAYACLEQALPLAKDDAVRQALLLANLSDLSLATHHFLKSREYADKSLLVLPAQAPPLTKAVVFNNLGNLLTIEAYYQKAFEAYTQSLHFAQQANDKQQAADALINRASTASKRDLWQEVIADLETALQHLETTPTSYSKTFTLISIGIGALRYHHDSPSAAFKELALVALNKALALAKRLNHARLLSYAYGYLGQAYESEQRFDESLQFTRQAIFFAQQDESSYFTQPTQASESLYRWQWQLGRLFKAKHQVDQAIEAYRQAVDSLRPLRPQLTLGYRSTFESFRETIGTVYFELASLLLQKASEDVNHKDHWLEEAVKVLELLKSAELQDYFQDDCVTEFQAKQIFLDKSIPQTAVIYPILLPNRLELLVRLPSGIERFKIPVSVEELTEVVNEFRFELESHESTTFLGYAQHLYQWLIKPLETTLTAQKIETLVLIPDGILRTIPFAALHDGKRFLIDQYAIAITPGLTLTGRPPKDHDPNLLIVGLAASVEGYPKLLNVPNEITFIRQLYHKNATLLLDENFTLDNFAKLLSKNVYSIVHIASHGEFDSDSQNTFILSYDGKLTMNRLEQLIRLSKIRNEPMELLVLSACQTAVGDDQAALGLAGVAIKAGASSALASLWFIDDQATSQLMGEFYRQLHEQQLSKAKALQKAQQYLLKQPRYQHPAFWAPFLLIGNWL